MEIEQITKRLEWLDDERRKDKALISTLENRISEMEEKNSISKKELSSLEGNLSQFTLIFGKLEQVESKLAQTNIDLGKLGDELDRTMKDGQHKQEKKRIDEIDNINKTIQSLRKDVLEIKELKKGQKVLDTDFNTLKEQVIKLDNSFVNNQGTYDDYKRAQKLFDETRKAENKRITDLQGEVSAYRKRSDELRAKIDLALENMRNIDTRIVEITGSEAERRQAQIAFIEKQNQQQVERDRMIKDSVQKVEQVLLSSATFENQLKSLEDTLRTARKAKDQLDDATQRIDRRVNEITEMHRLNEDHFRQEWGTFKADDQKRWANYNLIMDEQQKDNQRLSDKMEKRVISLEDGTQELTDLVTGLQNETEKRLQNLLSLAHDWLSAHQRVSGTNRDLE